MRPRRLLAHHDATEVFDHAVGERALAVVTVQQGTDWRTYKARFLERDPQGRFFVLDYQPEHNHELPPLSPGQYVGVSFRQRSRKVLFATVVEAKGHFVVDDSTSVPAVRFRWPDALTEMQRRAYFRTPVPPETELLGSLWSGGAGARQAAQANPLQIASGHVINLSCGGALLRLSSPNLPEWVEDETLGAQLQLPDDRPPIVVDVHFRGARQDETGRVCAAVQFVGLEVSLDGRTALQRISRAVQRLHRDSALTGRDVWSARAHG